MKQSFQEKSCFAVGSFIIVKAAISGNRASFSLSALEV
jgi:hypothetical protein